MSDEEIFFQVGPEPEEDRPPDPKTQELVVLDTQPAAVVMLHFEREINLLLAAAREIGVIQDQDTNNEAVRLGNRLKNIKKQLELHQDHFTRPHNEFVKSVRNIFKRFTEPMGAEERVLAKKVSDFRRFLGQQQRLAEGKARRHRFQPVRHWRQGEGAGHHQRQDFLANARDSWREPLPGRFARQLRPWECDRRERSPHRVAIRWVQEFSNVAVNQILTVYEPPAISAAVQADGACELTIKAEPNRVWQVQASSDLLNWQTLATVTNVTYQFQYNDPDAANHTSRFYRVKGH